jgi:hypothetical protein
MNRSGGVARANVQRTANASPLESAGTAEPAESIKEMSTEALAICENDRQ